MAVGINTTLEKNMKHLAKISSAKTCLIIPVENQVRELDPKLLLACIAARRGFSVIIGSHREIDLRIASLPRGLYLNKSMTDRNLKMFRIMHNLGHEIVTWDEEALVHLPDETYYSRRLSPRAIRTCLPGARTMPNYGAGTPTFRRICRSTSPAIRAAICCGLICAAFMNQRLKISKKNMAASFWLTPILTM